MEPYFYPQNEVLLDAKGFEVKSVEVSGQNGSLNSKFEYDGLKLKISGFGSIAKGNKIQISIDYVAKPNELTEAGSQAITSNKGLYFINPLGTDSSKPRQIWTQGETESSSCWFPTFETPNEKCTQEIHIKIENNFKTLSNGVLVSSKVGTDGFRIDHWEMKLPHSPYLFSMAIGEYSVVRDKWRDIPVNYWVEPKYEKYAKRIFGNTPQMIEYFSNKLGYAYPWPKYDQVVVRDFVSGAMENTSASTFMEALQSTDRELEDKNWDDIIAHELFHQWFGDLVTIESWANLPLNESFANYAQYLWDEYKYGEDEADFQAYREKQLYFFESVRKREPLIRYFYNKPDDMFDSHSYAKGGRILHMLRHVVGDEAFFEGLKIYLKDNAFKNAEIHHLRMAFEKATGKDLNWFFDQWFLTSGHPELIVKVQTSQNMVKVFVNQVQDTNYTPIYKIPVSLEVWTEKGCQTINAELKSRTDTISFLVDGEPETIIWDAKSNVLANLEYYQSMKSLVAQYKFATKGIHRYEALIKLKSDFRDFPHTQNTMKEALSDSFWANRRFAMDFISDSDLSIQKTLLEKIKIMASKDKNSQVRALAFKLLSQQSFEGKKQLLENGQNDLSLSVSQAAYKAYLKEGYEDIPIKIEQIKNENQNTYSNILAEYYSTKKDKESLNWFDKQLADNYFPDQYELIQAFGRRLLLADSVEVYNGLETLFEISRKRKKAEVIISVYQVFKNFINWNGVKAKRLQIKEANKKEDFGEVLDYLE